MHRRRRHPSPFLGSLSFARTQFRMLCVLQGLPLSPSLTAVTRHLARVGGQPRKRFIRPLQARERAGDNSQEGEVAKSSSSQFDTRSLPKRGKDPIVAVQVRAIRAAQRAIMKVAVHILSLPASLGSSLLQSPLARSAIKRAHSAPPYSQDRLIGVRLRWSVILAHMPHLIS